MILAGNLNGREPRCKKTKSGALITTHVPSIVHINGLINRSIAMASLVCAKVIIALQPRPLALSRMNVNGMKIAIVR